MILSLTGPDRDPGPNLSFETKGLRKESLAELASTQILGGDVALSGLVSAGNLCCRAIRLVTTRRPFRFLVDRSELSHLVEAWEEAVAGSEGRLEELASAHTGTTLLRPRHGTPLIVDDVELSRGSRQNSN